MRYKYIGKGKMVVNSIDGVRVLDYGDEINIDNKDALKIENTGKFEKLEDKLETEDNKKKKKR